MKGKTLINTVILPQRRSSIWNGNWKLFTGLFCFLQNHWRQPLMESVWDMGFMLFITKMSSVHLRKICPKNVSLGAVRGLWTTADHDSVKVYWIVQKCEGIDHIWVWMDGAAHAEQSRSWTQNNRATSVMVQHEAYCIKRRGWGGDQLL